MKGLSIGLFRDRTRSGKVGIFARFAELVFVGLIYFLCAKAGLALASINPSATPIWPATGFAHLEGPRTLAGNISGCAGRERDDRRFALHVLRNRYREYS